MVIISLLDEHDEDKAQKLNRARRAHKIFEWGARPSGWASHADEPLAEKGATDDEGAFVRTFLGTPSKKILILVDVLLGFLVGLLSNFC